MKWRGLKLNVNGVMAPYPEASALVDLVEEVLARQEEVPHRTLELGCGSGGPTIAMLKERIINTAVATDIDGIAVRRTRQNAETNEIEPHRLRVRLGRSWDPIRDGEQFDLIVANPPYCKTDECTAPDPLVSLDGGEDGLDVIREFIAGVPEHMTPGGRFIFTIGQGQYRAVKALLADAGLKVDEFRRCPRVGVIRYLVTSHG